MGETYMFCYINFGNFLARPRFEKIILIKIIIIITIIIVIIIMIKNSC